MIILKKDGISRRHVLGAPFELSASRAELDNECAAR